MEKTIDIYNLEHMRELTKERTVTFQGDVFLDHVHKGEFVCRDEHVGHNIIPTEGLNALLDTAVGGVAQIPTWYVGIFKGNYTPLATATAATALGAAGLFTECQDADYDAATNRPNYTPAAAAGGVITNAAAKAQFTIKAAITVYGAFLASSQAKTATTGKLLAAKKFDAARAVVATDILYVTYQLTAVSS